MMMFTRSVTRSARHVVSRRAMSTASPWADYDMAPPDPIIGLNEVGC
jgi:hypothetical protein